MRTDGCNFPVIHNKNTIRMLYGADALGDEDLRRFGNILRKCLADACVGACIHRTCGVVENKHLRFFQQCSGDAKPLLLPAGDVGAALFDIGVVSIPSSI